MQPAYRVPLRIRLSRTIMRPIFRGLFHVLSRVKVSGKENVPASGPYLIAINHVSLFEPPFILAFWPMAPEAVGAVDIWKRRGQASLVRLYGGIQVHRGEFDRRLLDTMQAVFKTGKPLLIAPEGGRSHTPGMRRALPGAAYAVSKAGVPVVPVGISGATDDFLKNGLHGKRPSIEMRIGAPFHLPQVNERGDTRRLALQNNADLIMYRIAELLPEEYRGVYSAARSQASGIQAPDIQSEE